MDQVQTTAVRTGGEDPGDGSEEMPTVSELAIGTTSYTIVEKEKTGEKISYELKYDDTDILKMATVSINQVVLNGETKQASGNLDIKLIDYFPDSLMADLESGKNLVYSFTMDCTDTLQLLIETGKDTGVLTSGREEIGSYQLINKESKKGIEIKLILFGTKIFDKTGVSAGATFTLQLNGKADEGKVPSIVKDEATGALTMSYEANSPDPAKPQPVYAITKIASAPVDNKVTYTITANVRSSISGGEFSLSGSYLYDKLPEELKGKSYKVEYSTESLENAESGEWQESFSSQNQENAEIDTQNIQYQIPTIEGTNIQTVKMTVEAILSESSYRKYMAATDKKGIEVNNTAYLYDKKSDGSEIDMTKTLTTSDECKVTFYDGQSFCAKEGT